MVLIRFMSMALNTESISDACEHVALNFQLPDGDPPEWLELIPADRLVRGRDGRQWLNDVPESILTAFNADGRDIVFDIEHATEIKAPIGEEAPAVGWIDQLEMRDGAIWGHVSWNGEGRDHIANRRYRYYSPAFAYEKDTLRIRKLSSVALTNKPNLRLKALNHQQTQEENTMWKRLLKALGLAEDATEEQALNVVSKLQSDLEVTTNRAETPDLAKFVPRADYDAALARATNAEKTLADKEKEVLESEITETVDAALKAGKITPATRDYYTAMCRQENGLVEFKKFLESAPVIGDPSGLDGKRPPTEDGKALNTEQKMIAEMFGNSAEDIANYGK